MSSLTARGRKAQRLLLNRWRYSKTPALFVCAALMCGLLVLAGAIDIRQPPVEVGLMTVTPSTFRQTVERRGVVEPFTSTAVKSACHWTTTILSIVPEGTWVQKGDVVCVLDAAEFEEYARKYEVTLIRYRGRLDNALHDEQMLKAQSERRLAAAEFEFQTSDQELSEYSEGTLPQQVEKLQQRLAMLAAQSDSAVDDLRHVERMWVTGMVSQREMEAAAFSLQTAEEEHRKLESELSILTRFSQPRNETRLQHRRNNALREIARTKLSNGLAETKARLTTLSYERTLHIYERRYRKTLASIENCTVTAPCDGQIVYGNSWYLLSRGVTRIEEGKRVRRQQKIFEIPDPDRLKVSVPLNESLIYQVQKGMPAVVTIPGYEDSSIAGEVVNISSYPRARSSYSRAKDYWLDVELRPTDEQASFLKPKADAVVHLTLAEVPDVLQIPRSSITGVAGQNFVYAFNGTELQPRQIQLGTANEDSVCVTSGLAAGDQLVTEMTHQHKEALEATLGDHLTELNATQP